MNFIKGLYVFKLFSRLKLVIFNIYIIERESMNQVVLVGRLCQEPEIISIEKENKNGIITLAVNRPFKNSDGIYETDFIRCILYNNIALNTFEYCHTGDVIGIKGRLQTRNNKDEKFIMEVIAEKVTFLSSNPKNKTE